LDQNKSRYEKEKTRSQKSHHSNRRGQVYVCIHFLPSTPEQSKSALLGKALTQNNFRRLANS